MSLLVKWAIGLAVAAALVFAGVRWYDERIDAARADGATTERAVWLEKERAREAAEKAAVLKQAQDAFAARAVDAAISFKVEADHAQAVQALNTRIAALDAQSRASGGLRIPKSLCAGSDGSAMSAGAQANGPDSVAAYLAGTVALPEDYQRRLRAVAIEADELTEDFRAVKNWAIAKGYMPVSVSARPSE